MKDCRIQTTREELWDMYSEFVSLLRDIIEGDESEEKLTKAKELYNCMHGKKTSYQGYSKSFDQMVNLFRKSKDFNMDYVVKELFWGEYGLFNTYFKVD